MKELVDCPDTAFRPVPWWCWTGEMNYAEMERQLQAMRAQGIREFFVFALYGLEFPFLGEAWWERVAWTLRRCAQLGMQVWIYDDYNWPSGTCAGRVLRDHSWTRSRRFGIERVPVKAGARVVCHPAGEWVGAVIEFSEHEAIRLPLGGRLRLGKLVWTNRFRRDVVLVLVTHQLNEYTGVAARGSAWCTNQAGYLDTLNPRAVKTFLGYIHCEYEKKFKKYFGTTLRGFFTDEPQLSTYRGTYCSEPMFSAFRKRYGYELKGRLHELMADTGKYPVTRYHFWSLLTRLFSRSYLQQISAWCAQRHLLHTGHMLGEESLAWNVTYSGDFYETQKFMQVPGIDLLGGETSYDAGPTWQFGNIPRRGLNVTAKLASSTARFAGRRRIMCEAFGVLPWSQTLLHQKHVLDWLCVLGINLVNDNLMTYTIKGFRKRAGSGKHFSQPWWKYYRYFADYTRRLCALVAHGRLESEIGVLYPTTQAWCLMKPRQDANMQILRESQSASLVKTEKTLYAVSDALLRIHRDYELLFDEVIIGGTLADGCLRTKHACFKTIILPGIDYVRDDVYARLCAFARAGGRLIIVGKRPTIAIAPEKRRCQVLQAIKGAIQLPDVESAALEARLAAQLPLASGAWQVAGEGARSIISAARTIPGGRVLLLANQSPAVQSLRIGWSFRTPVSLWDPDTDRNYAVMPKQTGVERYLCLSLAPHQTLGLVASTRMPTENGENVPGLIQKRATLRPFMMFGRKWRFETETPNIYLPRYRLLPVAHCDAGDKDALPSDDHPGWRPVARNGDASIELSPDNLACFWLRAEIWLRHIPADLAVVVDSGDYAQLWLNGHPLTRQKSKGVWDSHNVSFPLRTMARLGKNILMVKVKPELHYAARIRGGPIMPTFIEPVVVTGSFRVGAAAGREILQKPIASINTGSWVRQGYPYYAGTGVYSQAFSLRAVPARAFLALEKVRDVVEVRINGKAAGVRTWPPYVFDLSGLLRKGDNLVELHVSNTLGNLIQKSWMKKPGIIPAGLLGSVSLRRG